MADFQIAVAKTLIHEGGFVHVNATDEVSNFGVSVWFLRIIDVLHGYGNASPEEIAYVRKLSQEQAVALYQRYFWDTNHLGELHDQALADKVFDLAVNMGSPSATRMLQEAANTLSMPYQLKVDGELGERTVGLVNALNPEDLLKEYRQLAAKRYRQIASVNPALAVDLPEWLRRLAAA